MDVTTEKIQIAYGDFNNALSSKFEFHKFKEYCVRAFKYCEFDLVPEILRLLLPLANMVYYKDVARLDDRKEYKHDLIQDCISEVGFNMKYCWDRYIHVDDYYHYVRMSMHNIMLSQIAAYRNNYDKTAVPYDAEEGTITLSLRKKFMIDEFLDLKDVISDFDEKVLLIGRDLISHRLYKRGLMHELFTAFYDDKCDVPEVQKRVLKYRTHGTTNNEIEFCKRRCEYFYSIAIGLQKARLADKEDEMRNYEEIIARIKSDEYEALSLLYGNTEIPEIYAELGLENTMKLLNICGGRSVKFPQQSELGDTLIGCMVYQLCDGDKDNLDLVSDHYGLPRAEIGRAFNRAVTNYQKIQGVVKKDARK